MRLSFYSIRHAKTNHGVISRALALKGIRVFRKIKIMDTNCTSTIVVSVIRTEFTLSSRDEYSYSCFWIEGVLW